MTTSCVLYESKTTLTEKADVTLNGVTFKCYYELDSWDGEAQANICEVTIEGVVIDWALMQGVMDDLEASILLERGRDKNGD